MITGATRTSDWLALSLARNDEIAPGSTTADCKVVMQLARLAQVCGAVGPSVAAMLADPQAYRAAIKWEALFMLDCLAPDVRLGVLAALAKADPPTACYVYLRRPDLTDEEDALLWEGFAAAMPTMRKAIERGRLVRAKGRGDA